VTENLLADDVHPERVVPPVGGALPPEVRVKVAVVRERHRRRHLGLVVRRHRLHDALRALHVVEERLALRGLREALLGLRHLRVHPRLLVRAHELVDNPHLREQHLELGHLVGGHVLDSRRRLGGLAPDPLRRAGDGHLGSVPHRGGLGDIGLDALERAHAHQRRVLVVVAVDALALLLRGGSLLLANLLLDLVRAADGATAVAVPVPRHALGVLLAALVAGREALAVLGCVPLPLAVAAHVFEEERAGDRAILLVLDPVAREFLLRALGVEAETAEHRVRLGLFRRLGLGSHVLRVFESF